MGIDLTDIAADTATATVTFGEHTAKVKYHPGLLTTESIAAMNRVQNTDQFMQFLSDLIEDWDIKRGNKKVPTTPTGIASVPVPVLKAVVQGIVNDGQPQGEVSGG